MTGLETRLREVRAQGRTALVPYFMAGVTPDWISHLHAAVHAGADAIEIGLPFSDPMMDGVVIQEAGLRALAAGTTLESVCGELERADVGVPLVAMTYFNIVHHVGLERAAGRFRAAGITGVLLPDLTIEEAGEWRGVCAPQDLATIFMVAPSTTPERFVQLAGATQGFCYASARMAVTGKASGDGEGERVVQAVRDVNDVPTYIGIGITTPEQAAAAGRVADGVIVGSALVDVVLRGGGARGVEEFLGAFRTHLDA